MPCLEQWWGAKGNKPSTLEGNKSTPQATDLYSPDSSLDLSSREAMSVPLTDACVY